MTAERMAALAGDVPQADANAAYAVELTLDLATVTPHVPGRIR